MLRVWNPGRNEPREQREGEERGRRRALVEVEEVPARELARGGGGGGRRLARPAGRDAPGRDPDAGRPSSEPSADGEAGATTGLHVPRRTHRRITRAAGPYRRPWANPILWRELMTRAYGTKPLIIKGAYVLAFAPGRRLLLRQPRRRGRPLAARRWP